MMRCETQDIVTLASDVFRLTLGLELQPRGDAWQAVTSQPRVIEGCVHVTGDWAGAVVLQCARTLAERVAHIMFSLGQRAPTLADVQDAFGEITNMVGGNIKALNEGQCFLSLPSVVEGSDFSVRIPGTAVLHSVVFECEGEPLMVHVLGAAKGPGRA